MGQITKVTWRIQNFTSITVKRLCSENFTVDGNQWRLHVYPNVEEHLSVYLAVPDSATLPSGWSIYAQYGFAVINQFDRKTSITEVTTTEFKADESNWGFPSLLALNELHDPKRGYLVDDACLLEAYVSTDRTEGLISHELMTKTGPDTHKTDEADSFTQPSEKSVAFEPEDPTEEDMNTFFTCLESELSNSNIVFSQEEVKEALATLEESPKELADRAAKALQDKNCLSEKKSIKITITHKLDRNLIRYKEVESEDAAIHVQVEEAQKKRENMFG